jgi:NAD(P)-dependent dehydrogenase (short-subunit alcohol dehydrogenase family)
VTLETVCTQHTCIYTSAMSESAAKRHKSDQSPAAGTPPEGAVAVPPTQGTAQRLRGKVILVTGGTQGCGEGILQACADEGAEGLAFCGRQDELGRSVLASLEAKGVAALFVRADLCVADDVQNVVKQAYAKFGRIDGLVNCAADCTRGAWIGDNKATVELLDRQYALNFRAPFLLTQGVAEVMTREKTGGSIVNIGSVNAHGGQSNLPVYSSTKGALTTMTKHAAWALRKDRIRSNYIAVGWMFTPAEHKLKTTSEAQPGARDARHQSR